MKTAFLAGMSACAIAAALTAPVEAITLSLRTTGTGASAAALPDGTLALSTVNGAQGIAYLHLEIPGGIPLNQIDSISYTAKITNPGVGGYAPEVVLNIDADNNGIFEGSGTKFFASNHSPAELGGDNFLSGDSAQAYFTPDADFVTREVIGNEYRFFSANDARNANSNAFYTQFDNVLNNWLPIHDIDETDLVFSIDVLVGSSSNFDGMAALFQGGIGLNGVVYGLPEEVTLLGESFESGQSLDDLGFTSTVPSTGAVSIVPDPLGPLGNNVLSLFDEVGDPVSVTIDVALEEQFTLSFEYLFDTEGKLEIFLGDVLLDSIINDLNDSAQLQLQGYLSYNESYLLSDLGLLPGTHALSLVLSNVGDPQIFIDDLTITAPSFNFQQTADGAVVPEPVSATLTLGGLLALSLVARRRR